MVGLLFFFSEFRVTAPVMQASAMDSDSPMCRLRQGTFHAVVELRGKWKYIQSQYPPWSIDVDCGNRWRYRHRFCASHSCVGLSTKGSRAFSSTPSPQPLLLITCFLLSCHVRSRVRPTAHPSCPRLVVTLVGSELSFMQSLGGESRDGICHLGMVRVGTRRKAWGMPGDTAP